MHRNILQLFGEDGAAEAAVPQTAPQGAEPQASEGPAPEAQADPAARQDPEAALRFQHYQAARNAIVRQQYDIWQQQAEAAKADYPDLNMNEEVKNPLFRRYLHAGLDVASAYLLLHRQQILQNHAKQVESSIAQRMMVASTRPSENGGSGQASAVTNLDVASMTKKDRDAIRKRVARGERIRF